MKQLAFICVCFLMLCFSCKKDKEGQVEIVLLKSYSLVAGRCQVDANTAILETSPLVSNAQLLSYSPSLYEFNLTDAALQEVKKLNFAPFVLKVNDRVIYYGIIKSMFSSSSCDHSIAMTVLGDKALVKLGYPGITSGTAIDDQRNNAVLIEALRAQGKIK